MVRIDHARWATALTEPLHAEAAARLDEWFAAGRPAVARRGGCRSGAGVSAGVALPPSSGRLRLAFSVDRAAIRSIDLPPRLRDVIGCAPASWRDGLRRLAREADARALSFRVFGSLAWQWSTAMRYVSARSDVDLLFSPETKAALEAGVVLLRAWQASHALRADGEIVFPDGRAVAWREWDACTSRVLTKSSVGVALASRGQLLRMLAYDGR
ncbi:MAG: malonate decarboxylase holo-[acyl-carrier-protein] synthase [Vicinamibacteraceae bacterium]